MTTAAAVATDNDYTTKGKRKAFHLEIDAPDPNSSYPITLSGVFSKMVLSGIKEQFTSYLVYVDLSINMRLLPDTFPICCTRDWIVAAYSRCIQSTH